MKNIYTLLIVLLVFFTSCENNSSDNSSEILPFSKGMESQAMELIKSNNDFGFDLFKKLYSAEGNKNIMFSPTSVSLALAMTYNGANGDTKTAFENALKMKGLSTDEINTVYKGLINYLVNSDDKVLMDIANSIWYKNGAAVEQPFIDVNKQYYNAEVKSANFSDPVTLDLINGWVEDNTNGKIKDILDQIPGDAFMYLINTIYFKGMWKYKFKKEDTYTDKFYKEDGSNADASFMKAKMTINSTSNDMLSAIELPYGNNDYSMVVLLPNDGKKISDIIESLDADSWSKWMKEMSAEETNVYLPRFKFDYKRTINKELKAMGLGVAFSSSADFTGIRKSGDLFISRVIHQSFIEVNEEGTEAAAATVVEIKELSAPQESTFKANKPFIFVIKEKKSNAIVFAGYLVNP